MKGSHRAFALGAATAAVLATGCIEWFPGKVSKGVARLTVRNAGAILMALENDTVCGFSSGVQPVIDGELGTIGTATWTVSNCELAFVDQLEQDCLGEGQRINGRVVVSASKTITGWISGDPNEPIVPETEDAARLELSAQLFDFKVETSTGPEWLKMKSGTLQVVAVPRLALVDDAGACAAATPNVLFEEIAYRDAELHVNSSDRSFDVSVPVASLGAQAGIGKSGQENLLWGDITVWDSDESFEALELDPDYDANQYRDSYLCQQNYTLPLSHSCSLKEELGQGAARLFVRAFGYTYLAVDDDETCGFGGFIGAIPDDMEGIPFVDEKVTAIWNTYGCELAAFDSQLISRDCRNLDVLMRGSATVDARKEVVGEADVGNPPILPRTRREVTVEIGRMELEDADIWEQGPGAIESYMTVESGTLSGTMHPITGESAAQPGVYSIPTPVVDFSEISVQGAYVAVHDQGKTFRFFVERAGLRAFRGSFEDDTNWIAGEILVNGTPVQVSGDLQPEYSQDVFNATYSCTEDLLEVIPTHRP